jgi:hypothetical protein
MLVPKQPAPFLFSFFILAPFCYFFGIIESLGSPDHDPKNGHKKEGVMSIYDCAIKMEERANRLKGSFFTVVGAAIFSLLFLIPVPVRAEAEQAKPVPPPIAQNLVREGDMATRLGVALGFGALEDEAEAESKLGEAGIAPRNGWIADYPVTPDILIELHNSVRQAAEDKKIPLGRDEALQKLDDVIVKGNLPIQTGATGNPLETPPAEVENYPTPAVINNYYTTEGPPVVTYYTPPLDYYYLYSWVPSPFWCFSFWFPGFFILNDFHRTVFMDHRVRFISNHFNDVRAHRVFRVDPVARSRGRTFAGIGVSNRRGFLATGVPRSERRIFNAPRAGGAPGARTFNSPPRGGGRSFSPATQGGRSVGQAMHQGGGRNSTSRSSPARRGGGGYTRSPGK